MLELDAPAVHSDAVDAGATEPAAAQDHDNSRAQVTPGACVQVLPLDSVTGPVEAAGLKLNPARRKRCGQRGTVVSIEEGTEKAR
eukprot:SAG31_NODE_3008_length_4790_cov_327.591132_1_plen_85_part_00